MIEVDQQHLDAQLAKLGGRINWYADKLRIGSQAVVRRQSGLLAETMMKITPRADPAKIEKQVLGKFHTLSSDQTNHVAGPSGVKWYAFTPRAIYGVVADTDMSNADVESLYQLYYGKKLNKSGRVVAGQRGRQTVYLWQKITTKLATVKKLIARLKKHSGRQKASFVPSWEMLKSSGFRSSFTLPKYIADNVDGARGSSVNGLKSADSPSFTIISTAKGSGSAKMRQIAAQACAIRLKAMEARLSYLLKYPEKVGEEL